MAAGDTMQGTRVYEAGEHGELLLKAGCYGQYKGHWLASTPNNLMGDLSAHEVTEHEDGTITVSPSILVTLDVAGEEHVAWHGYLEHGVWREV